MENVNLNAAANMSAMEKINGFNRFFTVQLIKNKIQHIATFVCCVLHLVAYLPLVSNLLFLLDAEDATAEWTEIPVLGWFIKNFDFLQKDFKTLGIYAAIFLLVIPFVAYLAIKIIGEAVAKSKSIPDLTGEPKDAARQVYSFGSKAGYAWIEDKYLTKAAAWFGVCLGVAILVLVFIYGGISSDTVVSVAIGGAVFSAIMAGVTALISLPLKFSIAPLQMTYKKSMRIAAQKGELDKLWLSIDPQEAKRRKKAEEKRKRETVAASIRANTKIVIYYDDSIDTYGNLTLTVYIDGSSHRLRPGKNEFTVSPGTHRLNCVVYNDGSESASELGEIVCTVASGEKYEIDIPG